MLTRVAMTAVLCCGLLPPVELLGGPMDWVVGPDPVIGDGATDWPAAGGSFVKIGDLYQSWHNDGRTGQDNVIYAQSTNPQSWPNLGTLPESAGNVYPSLSQDGFHDAVVKNGTYYYWVGYDSETNKVLQSSDGWSDWVQIGALGNYSYKSVCPAATGFEGWFQSSGDTSCYRHVVLDANGELVQDDGCVLSADAGEDFAAFDVVCRDSGYQMWYVSSVSGMSYATSADGINWTKEGACSGFDGFTPGEITVIPDGTTLRMWFAQGARSEYYAEAYSIAGIPAVSDWGLIVIAILVLTAGTLVYARRRVESYS